MTSSSTPKVVGRIYQVGDQLGKGAFGKVFRGLNVKTGEFVAIKQMEKSLVNKEQMESITVELDLLQKLYHPNIVRFIDYDDTEQYLYFIMEYVEGGSLHEAMRKFGVFPESLLFIYLTQVLKGLHYLHEQGVIHRDIKGANILLTKEGQCKLADFGSCAYVVNQNNGMVGTPFWMAPEIIEGSAASIKSDIWSVGCSIIELLSGNPPYWNSGRTVALYRMVEDTHPPFPTTLSPDVEDLLLQCFIKDVEKRPLAVDLLNHRCLKEATGEPQVPASAKVMNGPKQKSGNIRISLFGRSSNSGTSSTSSGSGSGSGSGQNSLLGSGSSGSLSDKTAGPTGPSSIASSFSPSTSPSSSPSQSSPISSPPPLVSGALNHSRKNKDSIETEWDSSNSNSASGSAISEEPKEGGVDEIKREIDSKVAEWASSGGIAFEDDKKKTLRGKQLTSKKLFKGGGPSHATSLSASQGGPGQGGAGSLPSSNLSGGMLSTPSLLEDAASLRKREYEAAVTQGYCETIKTLEQLLHSTRSDKTKLANAALQSRNDYQLLKSKANTIKEMIQPFQMLKNHKSMLEDIEFVITMLNLNFSKSENLLADLNLLPETPAANNATV
eukprot:TRINITY_DN8243_c0_g1_i1.p1 TRINITY_DN8243_c0_g1~~TRINITY_DN8243_c0_g1_i1.p1  ORF type:complete len:609 (-),score=117.46 TRINITY_DN8243_c0_g1_i1:29-1855(-)